MSIIYYYLKRIQWLTLSRDWIKREEGERDKEKKRKEKKRRKRRLKEWWKKKKKNEKNIYIYI